MAKHLQIGTRKATVTVARKARASRSAPSRLVHDLLCRDAAKMYFDVLKKRVSQFKNSEEGRRVMCKAMEEFGNRCEARGKRETMLATEEASGGDGMRDALAITAQNRLILQGGG